MTLLIIGVMIGYVANAVIGVLKFFSVEEDIRAYVIWGLGSFSRVSGNQMMLFVAIMAILIPLSFLLIKTIEHQAGTSFGDHLGRSADGDRDGLLRTGHLSWPGRSAPVPGHFSNLRPPGPDACRLVCRCRIGARL